MVLGRALVHWFRQSRQSEPAGSAASDNHDSRRYTALSSSFPGIISSLLQSQSASRSTVTDNTDSTATSPSYSPLVTRPVPPAVSPSQFTPAQLASFFSHLPLMPASRRAGPAAADESVLSGDAPVSRSRVEPSAADWQMFQAERRHAGLTALLRPLPTFSSLTRCVFCFFLRATAYML